MIIIKREYVLVIVKHFLSTSIYVSDSKVRFVNFFYSIRFHEKIDGLFIQSFERCFDYFS